MASQTTIFERSTLYEEIWAEPMTVVARRYRLSDVGLRKICIALEIPVPARGYWAWIAAGRNIPKTALPTTNGSSTYTRTIDVADYTHSRCANGMLFSISRYCRHCGMCASINDVKWSL